MQSLLREGDGILDLDLVPTLASKCLRLPSVTPAVYNIESKQPFHAYPPIVTVLVCRVRGYHVYNNQDLFCHVIQPANR